MLNRHISYLKTRVITGSSSRKGLSYIACLLEQFIYFNWNIWIQEKEHSCTQTTLNTMLLMILTNRCQSCKRLKDRVGWKVYRLYLYIEMPGLHLNVGTETWTGNKKSSEVITFRNSIRRRTICLLEDWSLSIDWKWE